MLPGTFCVTAGYISSGALECRHDLSTARKFRRIKELWERKVMLLGLSQLTSVRNKALLCDTLL